jgi:hypothetical protein
MPPLVAINRPSPPPNLSPSVPSAFFAISRDICFTGVVATSGNQRSTADGFWVAGFGWGDATKPFPLRSMVASAASISPPVIAALATVLAVC